MRVSSCITKPNRSKTTFSGSGPVRMQGAWTPEGLFPFKSAQRGSRTGPDSPEGSEGNGPPPALRPLDVGCYACANAPCRRTAPKL
jgi:hypothetical protein